MQAIGSSTMAPNMVAAGTTVPPPLSPQLQSPPPNTFDWVCAWVDDINLNSPEKSDADLKALLKAKGYTSKRSLKYGILTDPERLQDEWGISEVLACQLSDEASHANALAVVQAPVPTPSGGLTSGQIQLIHDAVAAAVSATSVHTAPVAPSVKPDKAWTPFSHKFPPQPKGELRVPKTHLEDIIGTKLLYHAQSQSTTAGQHLMEYLRDPAGFHDEGVRLTLEARVSKHDNEQLASALMNSLPVEIAELLRLTHGTTVTGGTQLVSGFTILDYLWTPYVGVEATTYDHKQDTLSVEQPKLIPQCDQDLHAALMFWQKALRKLEAAHMAPTGFKLLDGLRKLISKLSPEFRQMLTQAEYLDTCNGKKAWTHEELLVHLHRHAAKALQQPRPANVTALFASADPTPDMHLVFLVLISKAF